MLIKNFINLIILLLILALFYFTYNLKTFSISNSYKSKELSIIDKPIVFDAQRKFLTAVYREKHTGDCDHRKDGIDYCLNIKPKLIVVHMTGLNTLEESFAYLKEPVLREERYNLEKRSYDRLNVSAHFLIDKNGTVYRLMPENYMARHAIGLNHNSIGIENVGLNGFETPEQVNSNVKLINYLKNKHKIEMVLSHSEISNLIGTKYYIEKEEAYFREKDCGKSIAEKIKKLLYD